MANDPDPNEIPHMTDDFDRSFRVLWTLFETEAKSYNNAWIKLINILRDNMNTMLIFVYYQFMPITDSVILISDQASLFASTISSFMNRAKQNDEIVYYHQQQLIHQQNVKCLEILLKTL